MEKDSLLIDKDYVKYFILQLYKKTVIKSNSDIKHTVLSQALYLISNNYA